MKLLKLLVLIGALLGAQSVMAEVVSRVVQHSNECQLGNLAPERLVMPEVLWALGINDAEDQVTFVLETTNGKRHQVALFPVGENEVVECVSAAGELAQVPLYQNNNDTNFWFEKIEGDHTVYWQFNEVYDTVKESIANLATRLTNYAAEHRIGKLILDLRLNMGGNSSHSAPPA